MNEAKLMKNAARFLLFLAAIFVLFLNFIPVAAAASYRLDDQAGLLTEEEQSFFAAELDRISEGYACDIVILTLGEDVTLFNPTVYADTYFEEQNLGLGADQSGMLFMLSMAERDWAIATHGEAIEIFNDYAQEELMNEILPALGDNNMSAAFADLLSYSEMILENAEKGTYAEPSRPFYFYLIPPALGLLLTAIIMRSLKSPLTSVGFHAAASSYLLDDSLAIATANDFFLSSSIARTIIPTSSDSGGGSGRSTTHTSSSGRTFGGSSGKF